jgi:WD40 repeat protein
MTRSSLLPFVAAVPWFAALAAAAPVPRKEPGTPISAGNASQVRSVKEVPKRADRVARGPKPGELIVLDWNNSAEVVDDANFRTIRTLAEGRKPTDIAVSPDGKFVAWTERDSANYTVHDGDKAFGIPIGVTPCDAAFSPDGKLLAVGYLFSKPGGEGEGHSEVRLFDLKGKLVRTLGPNGYGAPRPVFSPDGKTLAAGNRNCETQLFDVATGKLLHVLGKRMTQEVAFSPDGKTLAEGYVDGNVGLWDVATGRQLHLAASGCKEVYSVSWSPKGDVLASSGRDGKVVLWEPGKLEKLKELDAGFWVIQVRFTADGTRLLTSSASNHQATADRKIVTWAVPEGGGR